MLGAVALDREAGRVAVEVEEEPVEGVGATPAVRAWAQSFVQDRPPRCSAAAEFAGAFGGFRAFVTAFHAGSIA